MRLLGRRGEGEGVITSSQHSQAHPHHTHSTPHPPHITLTANIVGTSPPLSNKFPNLSLAYTKNEEVTPTLAIFTPAPYTVDCPGEILAGWTVVL